MLIMGFFAYKSLPNLLFGVLCLPGDQSHPFVQPTINPLACCICWAGLLGRAVFPPWNEGPNFGSYTFFFKLKGSRFCHHKILMLQTCPLYTGADLNLRDRVLDEVEKNRLLLHQAKGDTAGLCSQNPMS